MVILFMGNDCALTLLYKTIETLINRLIFDSSSGASISSNMQNRGVDHAYNTIS